MAARKNRGGRPKVEVDLKQIRVAAALHLDDEEIASLVPCSVRTFRRLKKRKDVRETLEEGRALGRAKLRRKQMETALAGNVTMMIYLGKVLLGQSEEPKDEPVSTITVNIRRAEPASAPQESDSPGDGGSKTQP